MKSNANFKKWYSGNSLTEINAIRQTLDEPATEKLLGIAMARGGDFAEVYAEYRIDNAISLEEHKIKQAQTGIMMGIGIRVLAGDKTGYAYTEALDFESLLQAAKTASFIAQNTSRAKPESVAINKIEPINLSPLTSYPSDMATGLKSDLLRRAEKASFSADISVKQVIASFLDSLQYFTVANSDGLRAENFDSLCRLNLSVIVEKNNQRQSGYHGGGGRVEFEHFNTYSPEAIATEAVRSAVILLDAREAPAGPREVVLGNGWSGILLHEAVGHGLEADFNRKKTSLYSDRIGQKVASELCTIIDDGTIPNRRGSVNIDDEGQPTCKNILIENGILKNYLYDKLNARLMNTQSTGSGRRETYRNYPMPRMTNTFMAAGESDPDDIIKSVKNGFYAKTFGGGQVDITNGQFVFQVTEGYLIEDGKLTAPVKGANLIGSGPKVLENVTMVGNDFSLDTGIGTCGKNGQSVPVGVGTPTCKISEITVGGTAIEYDSMTDGKV